MEGRVGRIERVGPARDRVAQVKQREGQIDHRLLVVSGALRDSGVLIKSVVKKEVVKADEIAETLVAVSLALARSQMKETSIAVDRLQPIERTFGARLSFPSPQSHYNNVYAVLLSP